MKHGGFCDRLCLVPADFASLYIAISAETKLYVPPGRVMPTLRPLIWPEHQRVRARRTTITAHISSIETGTRHRLADAAQTNCRARTDWPWPARAGRIRRTLFIWTGCK
nr:hypothetical protein [Escherichia coli]